MKTNNYEVVYTSKMKQSLRSTEECNYNQMGHARQILKILKDVYI